MKKPARKNLKKKSTSKVSSKAKSPVRVKKMAVAPAVSVAKPAKKMPGTVYLPVWLILAVFLVIFGFMYINGMNIIELGTSVKYLFQ